MTKKAITAIVVLIFLLAYPSWKIHKAKARGNHFSQQISVSNDPLLPDVQLEVSSPDG